MKRRDLLLAAMLLATAGGAQQHTTGTVSGLVLNRYTEKPIRKAVVMLSSRRVDQSFARAITDDAGRFRFTGIPAGQYRLGARRRGFQSLSFGADGPDQPGEFVALAPGEQKSGLTFRILPLAAIAGVVLDPEGDPLSEVQVSLLRRTHERGRPRVAVHASTTTDDRGEYRLFHVEPGEYFVMAGSRYEQAVLSQPDVTAGTQRPSEKLGAQFFPFADRVAAASPVRLEPGGEMSGVDFRLQPLRTAKLRARLLLPPDVEESKVITAQVSLAAQDTPGVQHDMSYGISAPDFLMQADELLPGDYLLVGTMTAGGRQYRGLERVSLHGDETSELDIPVWPGIDLAGVVQVEGEGAEKLGSIQVYLVPGDHLPFDGPRPRVRVDPGDRRFKLQNVLPGIWDIGVSPIPRGGYLKAMLLGERDVLTEDMEIGSDTTVPLKIVIHTQGGRVIGEVHDADGEPVRQAVVLLAPHGRYGHVVSFYQYGLLDAEGRFELIGVTPGSYRLYAFERMRPDAYLDPNFLTPYAELGSPLEMGEGEEISRNLTLIAASTTQEAP